MKHLSVPKKSQLLAVIIIVICAISRELIHSRAQDPYRQPSTADHNCSAECSCEIDVQTKLFPVHVISGLAA